MYLSSEKVISLFVLASPGSKFFPVQQQTQLESNSDIVGSSSFQDDNNNYLIRDVDYGYKGPGVYHISGYADHFNLVPEQIGSGDGAPVVVWQSNHTNTQRWYISDVGNGFVSVANNDTGALLSATSNQAPTRTYFSSPGKLGTHWRLDNYSSTNNPSNAVRITSAKYPTDVLAVYQRRSGINGTIVYNWPSWGQYHNEAWLLEYLAA